MTLSKKLYLDKTQLYNILEKKELNRNLFSKYYLRNKSHTENDINITVDTFSNFELLKKKNHNFLLGSSSPFNTFFFKKIPGYEFKLNTPLTVNSLKLDIVNSFYKAISGLFLVKIKFRTLLLLLPRKGGFSCYSFGLRGFLPQSHARFFMVKLILKLRKVWKSKCSTELLQIFIQHNPLKRLFIFRIPLFCDKVTILPSYKRRNFSKNKRYNYLYHSKLNIVFLYFKKKIKNVKNKKNIKNSLDK